MGQRSDATPQPPPDERIRWQAEKYAALSALAAGITHDFNNVLMVVLGNAELGLLDAEPNSPTKAALEQVVSAAERGAAFCKKMMAYAGSARAELTPTDLNRFLESSAARLLEAAGQAALHWRLADDLPAIEADAEQLASLATQLVANAAEAVSQPGGTVTLATGMARLDLSDAIWPPPVGVPQGQCVFLEIVDNGAGIEPAIVDRVCDPYFSTKRKGRGMGLAAVLGIAQLHRAAISIGSRPGNGTRVRVCFPPGMSPAAAEPPEASAWRGQGQALVIAADEQTRTVAAALMEHLGFDALLARDPAHAFDLLQVQPGPVAIILLEVEGPGHSVADTVEQLRSCRSEARILLLGAEQAAPADGVIEKPLNAGRLAACVRAVLAQP